MRDWNAKQFLRAYDYVVHGGTFNARGQTFTELENAQLTLNPLESPLTSFKHRNLNLAYAKQEFLWYLRGDKYDDSICKHATMWQKLKQEDGSFNSNYGHYIFRSTNRNGISQFEYVIRTLLLDSDSRRASIVLLNQDHLYQGNSDTVCTYAINFRIRNHKLNMTVHMRSNDVIFGLTNDVFCFTMLYRLILACLKKHVAISGGIYTHLVDSLHVYERHDAMIKNLIYDGLNGYVNIDIPELSATEANRLRVILSTGTYNNEVVGAWTEWLNEA